MVQTYLVVSAIILPFLAVALYPTSATLGFGLYGRLVAGKEDWTNMDPITIPRGSVALVTGGSRGIGLEVSRALAKGFNVVVASRTVPVNLGDVEWIPLDLGNYSSVATFSRRFSLVRNRLDVVIVNAAVGGGGLDLYKNDRKIGVNKMMMINHVSHARILTDLKPLMDRSPDGLKRVVFVSSEAQYHARSSDVKDIDAKCEVCTHITCMVCYAKTKLYQFAYARALSSRWSWKDYHIVLVDPGITNSDMLWGRVDGQSLKSISMMFYGTPQLHGVMGWNLKLMRPIMNTIWRTPGEAADRIVYALISQEVSNGDYVNTRGFLNHYYHPLMDVEAVVNSMYEQTTAVLTRFY